MKIPGVNTPDVIRRVSAFNIKKMAQYNDRVKELKTTKYWRDRFYEEHLEYFLWFTTYLN